MATITRPDTPKRSTPTQATQAGPSASQVRAGSRPIPRGQLFIGGTWRDSESGKTFTTSNPATGEVIAEVAQGTAADAADAAQAAREASSPARGGA